MTQSQKEKILVWLDAHGEQMIEDLCTLCRIDSVEGKPEEGAPYGRGPAAALAAAVSMYRAYGIDAVSVSGGRYGLAHFGTGKKKITLFGHLDVVPVGDGWEYTEPFTPIKKGGYLIGRGVHDDKSGIIAALYLLRAMKETGVDAGCRAEVFFGANEEMGMQDIDLYVKEQPLPDIGIVPDHDYPVCIGEKGICHAYAKARTQFDAILDMTGGLAANIVLDKLTVKLKDTPAYRVDLDSIIAKRDDAAYECADGVLTLTVRGLSAHASAPEGSKNALKAACEILCAMTSLPSADRSVLSSVRTVLQDDYGNGLGIAMIDPNFGATTAANGMVRCEGGFLKFSIDVRYGPTMSAQELETKMTDALADAGFDFLLLENRAGFCIDEHSPAAEALMRVYRERTGNPEARAYTTGGGSYSRKIPNTFGIGTELPGYEGDIVFAPGHGGMHQADESISIKGFIESTKMIAMMFLAVAETL